jgi:catechol 2,3-dioxygenase-like lactoylglutathione lyase family enzyme
VAHSIVAADLARSRDFYAGVLGGQVILDGQLIILKLARVGSGDRINGHPQMNWLTRASSDRVAWHASLVRPRWNAMTRRRWWRLSRAAAGPPVHQVLAAPEDLAEQPNAEADR